MAFKLAELNTDAAIEKAIGSVVKRTSTLRVDIHILLNAIVHRWSETGDHRPVEKHVNLLINSDLKGIATNGICEWIETITGFCYVEGTKEIPHHFVRGKRRHDEIDLQNARNTQWWTLNGAKQSYKPIEDPAKLLTQLVARFEKDRKKAGDESKVTLEMIAALKAVSFDGATVQ